MLSNRSIVLLAAAAVILGVASPFMVNVGPDTPQVLYARFYWLPGVVSNWLWPEPDIAFMVLTMAVYVVQYFAVFMFLRAIAPLARGHARRHRAPSRDLQGRGEPPAAARTEPARSPGPWLFADASLGRDTLLIAPSSATQEGTRATPRARRSSWAHVSEMAGQPAHG